MSRRGFFKYCLVWDKAMCGSFQNAKFMPLQIHEDVVVFSKSNLAKMKFNPQKRKGRMRVKGRPNNKGKETTPNFSGLKDGYFYINDEYFPTSILNFSNAVQINKFHPTQKSEDLFRYLIQTYSNEDDLIFDGYSGSGTTAAACIKEKRRFIGSELNKEYFDLSMKRLKEIMSKPELF